MDDDQDTDIDALILSSLWKNHHLIPPTSKFAKKWFIFIICLVIYNAVYIPIELCFEDQLTKAPVHIAIGRCQPTLNCAYAHAHVVPPDVVSY